MHHVVDVFCVRTFLLAQRSSLCLSSQQGGLAFNPKSASVYKPILTKQLKVSGKVGFL